IASRFIVPYAVRLATRSAESSRKRRSCFPSAPSSAALSIEEFMPECPIRVRRHRRRRTNRQLEPLGRNAFLAVCVFVRARMFQFPARGKNLSRRFWTFGRTFETPARIPEHVFPRLRLTPPRALYPELQKAPASEKTSIRRYPGPIQARACGANYALGWESRAIACAI